VKCLLNTFALGLYIFIQRKFRKQIQSLCIDASDLYWIPDVMFSSWSTFVLHTKTLKRNSWFNERNKRNNTYTCYKLFVFITNHVITDSSNCEFKKWSLQKLYCYMDLPWKFDVLDFTMELIWLTSLVLVSGN